MQEPGGFLTLGSTGAAAWRERVQRLFEQAVEQVENDLGEENRFVLAGPSHETTGVTGPDWTGLPMRVANCLGRERALRLLDSPGEGVDDGGRALQEDYVEWRATRSDGCIVRVELTTELADYWCVLAAHEPARLLEIVSEFAGESAVSAAAIFGSCDPFDTDVSAEERERAFEETMLPADGRSPYNNGTSAICCMVQRSNRLSAILALAIAAANCRVIRDAAGDHLRCLTCVEAIPLISKSAQLGRVSDPVLVERLGRIAYEGRKVAFDDPLGIYIQGVEHSRLRTPDGDPVPAEWFSFSRGLSAEESADGRARYQRVTFEVPAKEKFQVGDLVDVATELPIRFGGEIADLLRLAVFLRVSEPDLVAVDRGSAVELASAQDDREGCAGIREYEQLLAAGREPV